MKKYNEVFFSDKGMTSTSANHLANIAAEVVQARKLELENVTFISEYISVLGTNREKVLVVEGNSAEDITRIKESLKFISEANSFIAWVREAIKAKEEELNEISNISLEDYCNLMKVEVPLLPSRMQEVTEEDILGTWNIKERNEYYSLEAYSAAIGKFIHPNGAFSKARKQLQAKLTRPHSVDKSSSSNIVIYDYIPSVELSTVEDSFLEMQNTHRALTARLNQLKFRLKTEAAELTRKRHDEWHMFADEMNSRRQKLYSDLITYKNSETQKISQLKIVIPEALKEVFDFLQNIQNAKK